MIKLYGIELKLGYQVSADVPSELMKDQAWMM